MKNWPYIFSLLLCCCMQNAMAQNLISKNVLFDRDQSAISDEGKKAILNLLAELENSTEHTLRIVGHTDQDGTLDYNMKLSEKRAKAVESFVINLGYDSNDISLSFLGESDPLLKGSTAHSMQQNRRVSLVATSYNYDSSEEFVSLLETHESDKVIVDHTTSNTVELSHGTQVNIPANAFCNEDGTAIADGNIEMIFKEAFDFTQMVDERLYTETEDAILETGGMIYIEASQNGKALKLREGQKIELLFPKQKTKPGMQLFAGVNDGDGIIWEETGENIITDKEVPFIQVDLSVIKEFQYVDKDTIELPLQDMKPYPRAIRKPYPPAKTRYTEEKYAEVYQQYEDVLAQYYKDLEVIPRQQEIWKKELNRRKKIFVKHKREHTTKHVHKWLKYQIAKVTANSAEVSHVQIVNQLSSFLNRSVGQTNYKDLYYRNKIFAGVSRELLRENNVITPVYSKSLIRDFAFQFESALSVVESLIYNEKVGMGYVDNNVLSRYVVSTSNLGWINCDRFIQLEEDQKMDLHFADVSKDGLYYLVFKDIKSIIRPNQNNGEVQFNNIPIGKDVKLVSLQVKGKECFLASQDLKLGSNEKVDLQFGKVKLNDVRNVLQSI